MGRGILYIYVKHFTVPLIDCETVIVYRPKPHNYQFLDGHVYKLKKILLSTKRAPVAKWQCVVLIGIQPILEQREGREFDPRREQFFS